MQKKKRLKREKKSSFACRNKNFGSSVYCDSSKTNQNLKKCQIFCASTSVDIHSVTWLTSSSFVKTHYETNIRKKKVHILFFSIF